MTIESIKEFYKNKSEYPCPTEKLVKSGYQQRDGGYIERAVIEGIPVDYKENSPSQYWHLMTYCESRNPNQKFTRRVACGELLFWMAEVCCNGDVKVLEQLSSLIDVVKNYILRYDGDRPIYYRRVCNAKIQLVCFDVITRCVK